MVSGLYFQQTIWTSISRPILQRLLAFLTLPTGRVSSKIALTNYGSNLFDRSRWFLQRSNLTSEDLAGDRCIGCRDNDRMVRLLYLRQSRPDHRTALLSAR